MTSGNISIDEVVPYLHARRASPQRPVFGLSGHSARMLATETWELIGTADVCTGRVSSFFGATYRGTAADHSDHRPVRAEFQRYRNEYDHASPYDRES